MGTKYLRVKERERDKISPHVNFGNIVYGFFR